MEAAPDKSAGPKVTYRFGLFALDPATGSLTRNGVRVKLQDQPFQLLVLLLEQSGQIVSREEIQRRLWPGNTFVEFDKSLGVAVLKVREALADEAGNPRFVETIPRRGYRFIAPVSVQDSNEPAVPGKPDQDGAKSPVAMAAQPATAVRASPWRGWYWILPMALFVIGFVAYKFRAGQPPVPPGNSTLPKVRVRRSVAVLGFRNLPGRPEDSWLSAAFTEMLNTELAAGGELRLVSGEDVARAKSELPLTAEDTLAKSTLQRLHTDPGADVVVLGSYTPLPGKAGNHIRLDLRLQDTASGDTIAEESVTGNEEYLFDLVSQASVRLRQSLGLSALSSETTEAARASLPSNQQAVRLYAEGRARSWAFDFVGARDLLLKAVAADPTYPLAHAALAEAWDHLGYAGKARAEAQRALQLSEHLSQEERLLIEGQYRDTIKDYPKAIEAYQALFHFFPDSLEYGLRLASAQRWVKPADSLRTLDMLRHLPAPAGEDPRIDMTEASAWIDHDFEKAHAAAERAIAKGSAQGSHLLVARAYGILCQQGFSIGTSTADAIAACENARQSYAAAGDRNNEARTLNDFAGLYFNRGDLTRAEAMWREAIPVFRQVGDKEGLAATSNNLGDVFLLRGSLDEAKKFLQQAIPDYQAIEDKEGVALALNDLGDISRQKGDLEAALTTFRQAKATGEEIDSKNAIAYVLTGQGDVFVDQGDLAAARKAYEESLALRNQAGEKQAAAETQVALAQLAIEEGHAADAEAPARDCKEQFHREQQADDELAASVVLIQSLLTQSKHADAQKEMEDTQPLAAKSQNRFVRLQYALASARVMLMSDHPELSRRSLDQIVQEARGHGYVGVEFEAQLALAELSRKTGHYGAAQTQLAALEKAARAKGFGLIARKASAARG
ncbi:MAG: tetratricopeptide repeat protein [Acidobacteriia bacterium]|nr:tetratricopeptide repeat protein [Terriglobia bacterium]